MINYSQNKEQEVILNFFKQSIQGNFLDIGANDGETLSNTRALALKGWGGVVVEPTRVAFSKLSNLYSNNESVLCVNCAIGNKKQKTKINVNGNHIGEHDTGLLSTVKDEEKTRWKGEIWETEEIDMVTYQNLISIVEGATNDVGFTFDFISIDAEGCDIDILKQIDLRLVRMVCIEWNSVYETYQAIDAICESFGMKLYYKNAENLIYARHKA